MLSALLDASLIVSESSDEGALRFCFLETVRDFAAEKLTDEERRETRKRYAAYFVELAVQGNQGLRGSDTSLWCDRLEVEQDNFRAILTLCFPEAEAHPAAPGTLPAATGVRLVTFLFRFWTIRWHIPERERWLHLAFACADALAPAVRADFYEEIFRLYSHQLYTSVMETALALGEELSRPTLIAMTKLQMSETARQRQDYLPAVEMAEQAVTLLRETVRLDLLGFALSLLATCYANQGRPEARPVFEESLSIVRRSGDLNLLIVTLYEAAFYGQGSETSGRAVALLEEALALCARLKDRRNTAHGLWILGKAVRAQSLERAEACFRESLAIYQRGGITNSQALPLFELGVTLLQKEDYSAARACFLDATVLLPEQREFYAPWLISCALGEGDASGFHRYNAEYLQLTEKRLRLAREENLAAPYMDNFCMQMLFAVRTENFSEAKRRQADLVALVSQNENLLLPPNFFLALARLYAEEGESATAARFLGIESGWRQEHASRPLPIERHLHKASERLVLATLAQADYTALRAEGEAMNAEARRRFVLSLFSASFI